MKPNTPHPPTPQAPEVQTEPTPDNVESLQQHFSRRASAARTATPKQLRKKPLPILPALPDEPSY